MGLGGPIVVLFPAVVVVLFPAVVVVLFPAVVVVLFPAGAGLTSSVGRSIFGERNDGCDGDDGGDNDDEGWPVDGTVGEVVPAKAT